MHPYCASLAVVGLFSLPAVQLASLQAWPPAWSEPHTSGCCMLEWNKTITMFPGVSRQDVCGQSAICQADKIWTRSRTCYVGCCSWDRSSTEKDISFPTKDVIYLLCSSSSNLQAVKRSSEKIKIFL